MSSSESSYPLFLPGSPFSHMKSMEILLLLLVGLSIPGETAILKCQGKEGPYCKEKDGSLRSCRLDLEKTQVDVQCQRD